jgi:hypothetical protein
MRVRNLPKGASALGAVVVLGAGAAMATATIPAEDGVIHGCFNKSGGQIRVIDESVRDCDSNETELDWNVRGAAGPKGDTGPQGPVGPKGDTGPAWPAGTQGATGPAGAKGETGPAGPAGPQGETGPQGDTGPAGPQGPAGPAGANGIAGVETVTGRTEFNSTTPKTLQVPCPAGKKLISGGARLELGPGAAGQVAITDSAPYEVLTNGVNVVSDDTWFGRADSLTSTGNWRLIVYATCAVTG